MTIIGALTGEEPWVISSYDRLFAEWLTPTTVEYIFSATEKPKKKDIRYLTFTDF